MFEYLFWRFDSQRDLSVGEKTIQGGVLYPGREPEVERSDEFNPGTSALRGAEIEEQNGFSEINLGYEHAIAPEFLTAMQHSLCGHRFPARILAGHLLTKWLCMFGT